MKPDAEGRKAHIRHTRKGRKQRELHRQIYGGSSAGRLLAIVFFGLLLLGVVIILWR